MMGPVLKNIIYQYISFLSVHWTYVWNKSKRPLPAQLIVFLKGGFVKLVSFSLNYRGYPESLYSAQSIKQLLSLFSLLT